MRSLETTESLTTAPGWTSLLSTSFVWHFKKFTGAGIPVSQAERKSLQVKSNPATKEVQAVDGERLCLNSVRGRNGSRVPLNST